MIFSNHALIRKSQRGIRNEQLSLLFENSSVERAPEGVEKVVLKKSCAGRHQQKKKRYQIVI